MDMSDEKMAAQAKRVRAMAFAEVYPMYVKKVEAKGRTKAELDEVIKWLTGYESKELARHLKAATTFEDFFKEARLNPNAGKVTGVICGYRVEELKDEVVRDVRRLDKLVDELAKGRPMEKILRT